MQDKGFHYCRGWGAWRSVLPVACLVFLFGASIPRIDAAQVTLAWDATTNVPPSGYKIYYGYTSHAYTFCVDAGTATVYTISGLNDTATYYFAVTSYNGTNSESTYSGEITWTAVDADADGMADAWEVLYFSGTQATNGLGALDADLDGTCNLEEFILGSDPTTLDDFADVDISFNDGQCVVSFIANAASGTGYSTKQRYYTLERCNDLATGAWNPVDGYTSILATNQTVVCSDAFLDGASLRTRVWLQ